MNRRKASSVLYKLARSAYLIELLLSRNPARLLRYAKNRALMRLLWRVGLFR